MFEVGDSLPKGLQIVKLSRGIVQGNRICVAWS